MVRTNVGLETGEKIRTVLLQSGHWAPHNSHGSLYYQLGNGQNTHIILQKEKNNAARKVLMKMFVHNQKRYMTVGVICKFALGCELKWQILYKLLTRPSFSKLSSNFYGTLHFLIEPETNSL